MDNLRGAAFMVLAMLAFALEDMLIKLMAAVLPIGQIVGMVGLVSAVLLAGLLRLQGLPLFSGAMLTPPIVLRALGEMVGTIGFVTALALTPLSSASAILQATPLFVILGAALVYREAVGWRRWLAILVGLFGVLLIIRPGMEGFSWYSLFAVMGVIGLGVRDLATRRIPSSMSSFQLSFLAFLVLMPAGGILLWAAARPLVPVSPLNFGYLMAAVTVGIVAYYGIISAMRTGEIGFVSPFRYSRIIFALVVGITVFDERPDLMTLLGAAIIVASGLYTLWRERQVRASPL